MMRINEFLSNNKNKKIATIIFAVIGILILLLSFLITDNKPNKTTEQNAFIQNLEQKTKDTIEKITGNGTVEVMITLKNTYVISDVGSELPTTLVKASDNQKGYICLPSPEIAGVMIVCTSLENTEDFTTIKKAVSTCLDIKQSKIYIIGGKAHNEKVTQQH